MKSKRNKEKTYQNGGELLGALASATGVGGVVQAGLGAAQALYGLSQIPRARAEFNRARAAAPSLQTPAQFYENYRNSYDAELARMQSDAIQSNLATSVQALQGAGGRAVIGGLGAATQGAQAAQMQMLAQERAARMRAGEQLAAAEQQSVRLQEVRNQQQQAYANQAFQAALGNIGAGLGSVGTGALFAAQGLERKSKEERQANREQRRAENQSFRDQKRLEREQRKANRQQDRAVDTGIKSERNAGDAAINFMRSQGIDVGGQNQINFDNPPFFSGKSGGMMTKGEFSHDTNPIDLVQDGVKVGEATGGEYIINPTQAKKIAKQSSFARKLFKRFERKAKANK
jgi:hypothetical protein